ncbi:hypothetical protein J2X01_003899 [Arthrobacter ginsengisoli]|uniref:Uncharacterized protein n=1 Tax=Arthrobacter ginsengisoli TaxID=1356565 RepID=A0ABU1UHB6_9MICC|nr:hypothetical protein [Arthrobacter ginsengisoli]MDR7084588.1 hypothetical protein [Arthrobacter ginsengisoli]
MALALRKVALRQHLHPTLWARFLFGPASRGDYTAPVVHKHDDFEQASEVDLSGFEVETDAQGHHYAVRREDLPKEEV